VRRKGVLFLLLLFAFVGHGVTAAPAAAAARSEGLTTAWSDPGASRSAFFVRGMACRACTILIDRALASRKGVFWARFNYPLRLLVVYHDPSVWPVSGVKEFIGQSGELSAALLGSTAARSVRRGSDDPVASWSGGTLSRAEAEKAPARFEKTLEATMIERGTEEWGQIAYEIAGEEVRTRIFLSLARAGGYGEGGSPVELPVVISKDFYWPVELLPLTTDEAAIARFIRQEVVRGDETEVGRERFDDWLFDLWKDAALDFRGEILEVPE